MNAIEILNIGSNELNINLSETMVQQFELYYEILVKWNQKFNLTTIIDEIEVVQKHFLDSLAINSLCNLKSIERVIDIGTGAGFPGIPLKIIFPNLEITLVDSLNKRIRFLQEVIKELELKKIFCIHGRAEDLGSKLQHREAYDLCVSRAVANLSVLSEYCIPFVKEGGNFISYKATNSQDEINESRKSIKVLGGIIKDVKSIIIPTTDIERVFILVDKVSSTPSKYPRRAGIVARQPIK